MRCNAMHKWSIWTGPQHPWRILHRTVVPVPYGTCRLPTVDCGQMPRFLPRSEGRGRLHFQTILAAGEDNKRCRMSGWSSE